MRTARLLAVPLLVLLGALTGGCGGEEPPAGPAIVVDWNRHEALERVEAENARLRRAIETEKRRPARAARRSGRSTTPSARILSSADRTSFARLAASLQGAEGVAVSGLGFGKPVERLGDLRSGVAWSTSKVPVAMAVLAAGAGDAERADVVSAITASDNAAAMRLWAALGGGRAAARAVQEQLRAAGDSRTTIEHRELRAGFTPFGQSNWAITDQARFIAGLSCLTTGGEVLDLMGDIVAEHRWGLGAVEADSRFKGGWGAGWEPGVEGGYLDRQMGVVAIGGRSLAVVIATRPTDGLHATGIRSLTALAQWVVGHADPHALGASPAC